jgi:hypothetical protein
VLLAAVASPDLPCVASRVKILFLKRAVTEPARFRCLPRPRPGGVGESARRDEARDPRRHPVKRLATSPLQVPREVDQQHVRGVYFSVDPVAVDIEIWSRTVVVDGGA